MSKENSFAADLSRLLKRQGALVASYVASSHGVAGWPDKIVWSREWQGHMELKAAPAPDGRERRCTPKQLVVLREMDRRCPWSAVEVREIGDNKERVIVTRHMVDGTSSSLIARRDELLKILGRLRWDGTRDEQERK